MKKTSTLLGLFFLMTSHSLAMADTTINTEPFSLVKEGNQICKTTDDNNSKSCFERATSSQNGQVQVIERIELVQYLKNYLNYLNKKKQDSEAKPALDGEDSVGSALLFTADEATTLVKQYRRLSVRNLSYGTPVKVSESITRVPFYASVYWQGKLAMEGTINIDGEFIFEMSNATDSSVRTNIQNFSAARQKLVDQIMIKGFSDSMTEKNSPNLRYIETLARSVHFHAIGLKNGQSVDQATVDLLQQVVGPMIVMDAVYLPMVRAFGEAMVEILSKAIENIFSGE